MAKFRMAKNSFSQTSNLKLYVNHIFPPVSDCNLTRTLGSYNSSYFIQDRRYQQRNSQRLYDRPRRRRLKINMPRVTIQEWLQKYRPKVLEANPRGRPKSKKIKYRKFQQVQNYFKPPKSLKR